MPRGTRKLTKFSRQPEDRITTKEGEPETFGESLAHMLDDSSQILASLEYPNRLADGNPFRYEALQSRYQQIEKGVLPFNLDLGGNGTYIDIQNLVLLCQKAYFNVPIVKQTVDILTDFCNTKIMFKGGNEKSRQFFYNWFYNKIGGYKLLDQFFREWYRSGNVFLYRFDGDVTLDILKRIGNVYGADVGSVTTLNNLKLPIRYVMMNPAFTRVEYSLNFSIPNQYYQILSLYEVNRLRAPITKEEIEFKKSLPSEVQQQIDTGAVPLVPLVPDRTYAIFNKKQDYEPFAVPPFFSVMSDIDLKMTFKAVERILARTVEYVILLIKIGTEENPNPAGLEAMKNLMRNETLGRVLVADGTTEMDFVIPDINKVLGAEKYKEVNQDIADGLMSIFFADEKFSTVSVKIKIFVEKLKEARKAFLEYFLNPEIKRISETLGFKNYPTCYFADIDLNDQDVTNKVTAQLAQLGILAPKEVIENIQTGYFPSPEESLDAQKELKQFKDQGLYQPLIGQPGAGKQPGGMSGGRPTGATAPQTTKNPSPPGTTSASEEESIFVIQRIAQNTIKSNEIHAELEKQLKNKFKIKTLKKHQKEAITDMLPLIIANEEPDNWMESVAKYIESPLPLNNEVSGEIDEIMAKYDADLFLATILYRSKK